MTYALNENCEHRMFLNIRCSIQQNNFVHRTYQHIGIM